MKNFKYWAAYLVVCTMIFTSCSKEDAISPEDTTPEMVELRFSSELNEFGKFQQTTKESHVPPQCSDDQSRIPTSAFVKIAGLDGETLPLNDAGQTLTGIMLAPGDYMLEEFIIQDQNGDALWAAPHTGSEFEDYVTEGQSLPRPLEVVSGGKPYISQEVLCYSEEVRQFFGFLFFDYIEKEFRSNFCMFVNYCEDDMDYPALFSIDVWEYDEGGIVGDQLVLIGSDMNSVIDPNLPQTSVLCTYLPELSDGSLGWWIEVTVEDTDYYANLGPNPKFPPIQITPDELEDLNNNDSPLDVLHYLADCFPEGGEPCEGETFVGQWRYGDARLSCGYYGDYCTQEGVTDGILQGGDVNTGYVTLDVDNLPTAINIVNADDPNMVLGYASLSYNALTNKLSVSYNIPNESPYQLLHVWGQVQKIFGPAYVHREGGIGYCSEIQCNKDQCSNGETLTFHSVYPGEEFLFRAKMCLVSRYHS
jgi:hypothetical protein